MPGDYFILPHAETMVRCGDGTYLWRDFWNEPRFTDIHPQAAERLMSYYREHPELYRPLPEDK